MAGAVFGRAVTVSLGRAALLWAGAACALPATYWLAQVYSAEAVEVTVAERKMGIRFASAAARSRRFHFDGDVRFRTSTGAELRWQGELSQVEFDEFLALFDALRPGEKRHVYRIGEDVLLRRGLQNWRLGGGYGLAIVAVLCFFFWYVATCVTFSGGWWFQPQRIMTLMGLVPLLFGAWMYRAAEEKSTKWPRVEATVVKSTALAAVDGRRPELTVDARSRELLEGREARVARYRYSGREYTVSARNLEYPYTNEESVRVEKAVNPGDPWELAEIPAPGDDGYMGAKVFMGLGGLFVILGLALG